MNTRLQVEHPVTEFITGIDLVEWQLLAAAGEKLPLTQAQIRRRGHAIEARITAERADLGFRPATGALTTVVPPRGLRFDAGVEPGSQVSLYYDSLLAKLIAHGADRTAALTRLAAGLAELRLMGLPTTQAFLRDAVRHRIFETGAATTRFIETAFPEGWKPDSEALLTLRAAACVAWGTPSRSDASAEWVNPWARRSAVRVTAAVRPARLTLHLADEYGEIEADLRVSRDGIAVELDGRTIAFDAPQGADDAMTLTAPGIDGVFFVQRRDGVIRITRDGLALATTVEPKIDRSLSHGHMERSGNAIEAPLHGVVSQLHVALGDTVEKGAPVLQMEAMKLIHTLNAPLQGRVAAIRCTVGETVPAGAVLVEIAPGESP